LKPDFVARFSLRLRLPGLEQRREDIPLLLAHLLREARLENPSLLGRFFEERSGSAGHVRVDPMLVERLLRHEYRSHVRELKRLLWTAAASSPGRYIALTDAVRAELDSEPEEAASSTLSKKNLEHALERAGGSVTRAARLLGLRNRYVLYRLLRKYDIRTETRGQDGEVWTPQVS
jgi:DNA-binding NtrC family response regulator